MKNKRNSKRAKNKKQKKPFVWLIIAFGGILLYGAIALVLPKMDPEPYIPEVFGAPSMKVDKEKIDLGDVRLGKTVYAKFKLTNVGDEILFLDGEKSQIKVVEGC